jgi:serine/threonine-protein kinase SRPK3
MSTRLKGSLLRVVDFTPGSLEEILYELGVIKVDEVPGLAAFLTRCLTLDPSSRPIAFELLSDDWFNHW